MYSRRLSILPRFIYATYIVALALCVSLPVNFCPLITVFQTIGKLFEIDSANTCTEKLPLTSLGGCAGACRSGADGRSRAQVEEGKVERLVGRALTQLPGHLGTNAEALHALITSLNLTDPDPDTDTDVLAKVCTLALR